jgi:hypothetical protein
VDASDKEIIGNTIEEFYLAKKVVLTDKKLSLFYERKSDASGARPL